MKPQDGQEQGADAAGAERLPPGASAASIAQAIGARNLIIIIVTMPLVFIAVVLATLAIFGKPGAGREASESAATITAGPEPSAGEVLYQTPARASTASIAAPAGASVSALAMDGDRLAVTLDTAQGSVIVIYDLTRGVEVRRITVTAPR